MKNNNPKQTEYCPTCGAPVTYSGIGCDYIPETVNAELLEALQDTLIICVSRGTKLGLDDQGPVLDKARAALKKATGKEVNEFGVLTSH
jgi:hypothetical protein